MAGTATAKILFENILSLFPDIESIAPFEGVLLKFQSGKEVHLNVHQQAIPIKALVNLFDLASGKAEEYACFEVTLDVPSKTAIAEKIRSNQDKPLAPMLMALHKEKLTGKQVLCNAGTLDVNRNLFKQLCAMISDLQSLPPGQGQNGVEGWFGILSNNATTLSLEISDIGLEDFSSLDVIMDKTRQTASVVAVRGPFGSIPNYLAYPDGLEMQPDVKASFSKMLLESLGEIYAQSARALPRRFA